MDTPFRRNVETGYPLSSTTRRFLRKPSLDGSVANRAWTACVRGGRSTSYDDKVPCLPGVVFVLRGHAVRANDLLMALPK